MRRFPSRAPGRVTPVTLAGQIGHHLCARVHKDIACIRRGGQCGTYDRLQPRSTRRSYRGNWPSTPTGDPQPRDSRGHRRQASAVPPRTDRALRALGAHGLVRGAGGRRGVNSAKLRKDFSYLGSYGTRGVGYDVEYLVYQISRELGLTQDWPVVIVGIGNLGAALANYGGFASRGFRVAALIDADPGMAGKPVAGIPVQHTDELEKIIQDDGVSIGVIATPPVPPSRCCDRLVAAGVTSILNFAPTVLNVPEGVDVRKVDLSIELQILAFHEQRKAGEGGRGRRDAARRRPQAAALHRPGTRRGRTRRDAGMSLLVVGLSHRSAPVSVLERASLNADAQLKLLQDTVAAEPGRRGRAARHLQPHRAVRRRGQVPRRCRRAVHAARPAQRRRPGGADPPPLRALRGPGRPPPVLGGLRARLDGRRRGADPRPDKGLAGPAPRTCTPPGGS